MAIDSYRTPAAKARADALSGEIIGAAIEVHRQLGPGLLESTYRACLVKELRLRGIAHRQEVALPINYRGILLEAGYRLDLLVDDLVILELKSVQRLEPIHEAQLLSYLRMSGRWLGLLLNFNTYRLRNGGLQGGERLIPLSSCVLGVPRVFVVSDPCQLPPDLESRSA